MFNPPSIMTDYPARLALGAVGAEGDALLQKSFTVDFLTKKKKANEGEIPQYYVKDNHEAIIDPETFEI